MKKGRQGDGGGRPIIVFTEEQIKQVEKLSSVLSVEQLADYFGISQRSFDKVRERQPEVLTAYKKGKAKAIGSVANGLLQKAKSGDTTAMMFYLKTQAGWREKQEIDHTSSDGSMSNNVNVKVRFEDK